MSSGTKSRDRNGEIVTFFYKIFGHRIHGGLNPDDARREAYDAVALRYEISRGRLLNIISEHRNSQTANVSKLRNNAITLIGDLRAVNEGLQTSIDKNERLISLLQECLEDD